MEVKIKTNSKDTYKYTFRTLESEKNCRHLDSASRCALFIETLVTLFMKALVTRLNVYDGVSLEFKAVEHRTALK